MRSLHGGGRRIELRPNLPVISFAFDDFPRSAARLGANILRQNGVSGTYYASFGLMDRPIPAGVGFSIEDLRRVVAEEHELGCHTFDHCNAWETRPSVFEKSVVKNKWALAQLVPGASFKTLSYPIATPRPGTKRRVAKHYMCSRGGGQTFNLGTADANNLSACFLEKCRDYPEELKRLIDDNARNCGWLICVTHDISESPTEFGCTPTFFESIIRYAVRSGSKVLPVGAAWTAITGKDSRNL